jgi:hypothetical protein
MNEYFLYGIFGGLLAEFLGLYQLRTQAPDSLPAYFRSPFYWLVTLLMILAGGGLVYIYDQSGLALKPLIAVNIGASAPLIIGSLIQTKPLDIN